jgi:hypothetical protein
MARCDLSLALTDLSLPLTSDLFFGFLFMAEQVDLRGPFGSRGYYNPKCPVWQAGFSTGGRLLATGLPYPACGAHEALRPARALGCDPEAGASGVCSVS